MCSQFEVDVAFESTLNPLSNQHFNRPIGVCVYRLHILFKPTHTHTPTKLFSFLTYTLSAEGLMYRPS